MNDSQSTESNPSGVSREEMLSALFAQMVIQQANMAMMLLGKVPHPRTGEVARDIEGARMFIDQLEMLEAKTKGNLSKEEEDILKQSLMALRLGFVEAVDAPAAAKPSPGAPQSAPAPAAESEERQTFSAPAADEESKKKFSKKY
jgi:hypothetical protein